MNSNDITSIFIPDFLSRDNLIDSLEKVKEDFLTFSRDGLCTSIKAVGKYGAIESRIIIDFLRNFIDKEHVYYTPTSAYWYRMGRKTPRVELLNRAIEYLKTH